VRSAAARLAAVAKVTIIGAGSVEFTRSILADLCAYEELHGSLEIALHDIDAERLAYVLLAADQLVERANAGYPVSAHESRASAFDGGQVADVLGGVRQTIPELEVLERYP
jgi:alpha-galactosidase